MQFSSDFLDSSFPVLYMMSGGGLKPLQISKFSPGSAVSCHAVGKPDPACENVNYIVHQRSLPFKTALTECKSVAESQRLAF
jgi:hypothetical protein